jgi:indole-3-glycerol phosphate synthase
MMVGILDDIVERVRGSLNDHPPDVARLTEKARAHLPRDFKATIEAGPRPAMIAEFKRRSPSRGALGEDPGLVDRCRAYRDGGASAISVLTDAGFAGELADLEAAREGVDLALLRKDFIIDPRQLIEAAAYGADCVLLITRIVAPAQLAELAAQARALRLQTLVEVYEERELDAALAAAPDLLGVNSRDLETFDVDTSKFARVAAELPAGLPLVAESGIATRGDVVAAGAAGARAVLVGETLMRAVDPAARVRELLGGAR